MFEKASSSRTNLIGSQELADAFRRLWRHYIPTRYPDAHPGGATGTHYGETDAREALDDAQLVLRTVDQLGSASTEHANVN